MYLPTKSEDLRRLTTATADSFLLVKRWMGTSVSIVQNGHANLNLSQGVKLCDLKKTQNAVHIFELRPPGVLTDEEA